MHGNRKLQFPWYINISYFRRIFDLTYTVFQLRKVYEVYSFHNCSLIIKKLQVFCHLDDVDFTALLLLIEMIEGIKDIGHAGKNENELRFFETICMIMLVLSQKKQDSFHTHGKNTIHHLSPE